MNTALLFGVVVCLVAVFVAGVLVGRRRGQRGDLESAVRRYLDASAAASRPRAGYVEHRAYDSARRHMTTLVAWEPPPPSGPLRVVAASQEIAS